MKFVFLKVTSVMVALFLGIIVANGYLKSDEAIANPGGTFDYIQVWAMDSCLPGLPSEAHIILFDSRNGDVWAYSDTAMVGKATPSYVGKLTELGKPIMKK
jgi:hypothetical protein